MTLRETIQVFAPLAIVGIFWYYMHKSDQAMRVFTGQLLDKWSPGQVYEGTVEDSVPTTPQDLLGFDGE